MLIFCSIILEYATLYDENQLAKKCLKYIQRHTTTVLQTGGFTSLARENVELILSLDSMAASEDHLVDGLLRWADVTLNNTLNNGEQHEAHAVFDGLFDKIRLPSLSEGKLEAMLSDGSQLHHQLAEMLKNYAQEKKDSLPSLQPRLEMPTGHVTCDVIQNQSSCLIYNGRACSPLIIDTSEPIRLNKLLLVDNGANSSQTRRISVTIKQNGAVLTKLDSSGNYLCRKTGQAGPLLVLSMREPVEIKEGQFEIIVQYRFSHGSYGRIQTGMPKGQSMNFGALSLQFPNLNSTPVAGLEFSLQ